MICNKCHTDLPETKFKIKYYKKWGDPCRRKTCVYCKPKEKNKSITQKKYQSSEKAKARLLSNPENLFKQRSIKRIYIARKKYGDDIVTSSVRKEFITEKFKKQKHKCPSCKTKISLKDPKSYQIDHIIPFCQGGTHEESNIQFMCPKCHRLKSGLERKSLTLRPT